MHKMLNMTDCYVLFSTGGDGCMIGRNSFISRRYALSSMLGWVLHRDCDNSLVPQCMVLDIKLNVSRPLFLSSIISFLVVVVWLLFCTKLNFALSQISYS